jgi:hypothetical protein
VFVSFHNVQPSIIRIRVVHTYSSTARIAITIIRIVQYYNMLCAVRFGRRRMLSLDSCRIYFNSYRDTNHRFLTVSGTYIVFLQTYTVHSFLSCNVCPHESNATAQTANWTAADTALKAIHLYMVVSRSLERRPNVQNRVPRITVDIII